RGLFVRFGRDAIEIVNGDRVIRMHPAHWFYAHELIDAFDFYFAAVAPTIRSSSRVVDYSFPRFHEVVGYAKHPVYFPSFAEPFETTTQYTEFAALKPGMAVIDLGAYAGLTSMVFQDAVGPTGTVVAVEADENNVIAIRKNFALYRLATGFDIKLLEGAAWKDDAGIEFSAEGNMGASAAEIVGPGRGSTRRVPSFKLSSIAERTGLDHVEFIKCDVEGAEEMVFSDAAFFRRYAPKIIVEPHMVRGTLTTESVIRELEGYGYTCKQVPQWGYTLLPLVECSPPQRTWTGIGQASPYLTSIGPAGIDA
ncbi:MAG: FkbM family methyltransferase, partial [Gemmatimonas sp.]